MKARDIIYGALRLIQVMGNDEQGSVSAQEELNALSALQMMVSSWSARDIILYATIVDTFALYPGKPSYSIGNNSVYDFDTYSPQKITNLFITDSDGDTLLTSITEKQYFEITQKGLPGTPTHYYYKYGHPFGVLSVWPTPDSAVGITFASYKNYPVIPDSDLETDVDLPAPYLKALKYNLAIELAPEYATDVPPAVQTMAASSLESLVFLSMQHPSPVEYDPSMTNKYNYNYYNS